VEGISISHPRLPKLVTIQAELQKGRELRIQSYPIFGECLKEQAVSSYQIKKIWTKVHQQSLVSIQGVCKN